MTRVASDAVWTIVVAGGAGRRFGTEKQFEMIGSARVIDRACAVARQSSDDIVVVLPTAATVDEWESDVAVVGGATRSASVRAGLAAVPAAASIVCVHDAARPLATPELFARVIDAVRGGADAAIPGVAVTDTIKIVDGVGMVVATPDRSTLVAVQTPQAFRAAALREAHAAGGDDTDDAALVERRGGRVVTVAGEPWNRKITDPDDLDWVRAWLAREAEVGS
ncbi:MAG: 2-C-methyl-D-erythritol 4-phosphate cytidylyltransferase [Acidimicrobiales bacterium]